MSSSALNVGAHRGLKNTLVAFLLGAALLAAVATNILNARPVVAANVADRFQFPLTSWTVSGYVYGDRWRQNDLTGGCRLLHTAVDLQASPGQSVFAVANGTVIDVYKAGDAWNVLIQHSVPGEADVVSQYQHLDFPMVKKWAAVWSGETIATVFNLPSGPHLHFAIWRGSYAGEAEWGMLPDPSDPNVVNGRCEAQSFFTFGSPGTTVGLGVWPAGFIDPKPFLDAHTGPAAPGQLIVTGRTLTTISLAWSASPTPGVFYKLMRKDQVQDVYHGAALSWIDTPPIAEFAYTYSLEAVVNNQVSPRVSTVANTLAQSQGFLSQAYWDLFKRQIDPTGYDFFSSEISNGYLRPAVTSQLVNSPYSEFYNNTMVPGMYLKFLRRAPDASGLSWSSKLLAGGATYEQVAAQTIGSDEYFKVSGATNPGFVSLLYWDVLGRSADGPGLAFWTSKLNAGASRTSVASTFLTSSEGLNARVDSLYRQFLRRPADPSGLAVDVPSLGNGTFRDEDVISGLVGSKEYFDKVVVPQDCRLLC